MSDAHPPLRVVTSGYITGRIRVRLNKKERNRDPARYAAGMDGWPRPYTAEQRLSYMRRAKVIAERFRNHPDPRARLRARKAFNRLTEKWAVGRILRADENP